VDAVLECPVCHGDEWRVILPAASRKSGSLKTVIECLGCGHEMNNLPLNCWFDLVPVDDGPWEMSHRDQWLKWPRK
jgi:hypothetical protein